MKEEIPVLKGKTKKELQEICEKLGIGVISSQSDLYRNI